ncbi:MAG TPA: diguanylate cyclase [Spirochaetota bacterium]|nr:diguanylate cyclase [Spirochaetota bacterium]
MKKDLEIKSVRNENSKILIVDDSEDILFLVKNILALESYVAMPVNSAIKALEIIDKSFDAVVLDLMMPEMDGFEFLKKIRENSDFDHIPVIILTAKNNKEDAIVKIFEAGANDYITKPFLKDEFTARIKVHVKLKKMTEALFRINRKLKKKIIETQKAVKIEEKLNERILERNIELKNANERIEDLNRALEYSATHDSLTNILNRGAVLSYLENDIKRSKRLKSSLSLLMFDIDFFKKINDTYGHLVGDEVLRQLTTITKDTIREIDLFGRYGGEEFLIILPDTNIEQAKILAERLIKRVRHYNFLTNKTTLRVTISIGLTEYSSDESIDLIIEHADSALYEAKEDGRDNVKIYKK